MSTLTENPYAPPEWHPTRCQIRFSRALRTMSVGLAVVIVTQCLTGAATAVVITQEGVGASTFIIGITLFTLIVSSLISCASAIEIRPAWMACIWGLLITASAWAIFLCALCLTAWFRNTSPPVTAADLGRITVLAILSMIVVQMLIHRFFHLPADAS